MHMHCGLNFRFFDIRLGFSKDRDGLFESMSSTNNPLVCTHAGVILSSSWKDVVRAFVNHIECMKKAGKTDFIMFTIKVERDVAFGGGIKFNSMYHYAMAEAVEQITEMKLNPSDFMQPYEWKKNDGAPIGGYTVNDLNHKVAIVLNDYDGGMTSSGPDVRA